ncbi:MAG: stringent starvation protein SspA [Nevskia sp.]
MALRSRTKPVAAINKPAPNVGLTLFVGADSLHSDWARLVLAEKDIDSAKVQMIKPSEVNEDFLVLNPAQTLPTLADREGVIQTARVIVEYLDERYPHPPMMPQEPAGRARVRMTLHRIEHELFPLAIKLAGTGAEATAAKRALLDGLRNGARFFPARGHFLGTEYSLADSAWAVLLRRLQVVGVALPPEAASVRAYSERLFARAGFQRCFNGLAATARRKN